MSDVEGNSQVGERVAPEAGAGVAQPPVLAEGVGTSDADSLLGRVELIEAQPLPQRAAGLEQLHDELLAELQRGDHGGA